MQAPRKPHYSPRCMKILTSQSPPQMESTCRSGGRTACDRPPLCLGPTPRGGMRRPGARRSDLDTKSRGLRTRSSPPSQKSWISNERCDSLQVAYVVRTQDSKPRTPCHEGFHGNIHHRRKALVQKISQVGKDTPGRGVEADQDIEQ